MIWRDMKPKEKRVFAIVATFLVVLIILVLYACLPDGDRVAEGAVSEQLYQGVPLDEHLLKLDKQALEKAYEQHVLLLFSVWLKDDISVVHRINTGLRRGREAYGQAATRIEEREKSLEKTR